MHLIFDFDGTMVDSFHKAIEKFNLLALRFHFRPVLPEEIHFLRDLSSKELIKYFEIPLFKIPRVLHHARKEMNAEMPFLAPVKNLYSVLKSFHEKNFSLGILSSNSSENVNSWLELHNMKNFFNFIHTESSFFGKSRLIKKILKKYHINKDQAFYIGDETRDIEAAKQNDIYSIAVTWGFNSEKALLEYEPSFIAREPEELEIIFEKLNSL